ncbi:hypothetical protein Zm00014a_022628 [Zea mays]|uniref:Uncharacterized protein n=1 Tax=Zea mays TaxID=4577 RepID=A0A3L6FNX2_MAIZE|nr:hypothetical protein Zm00014a_022628 [Zea mays]
MIDLMMSDRHPVKAMCDIRDLGLFYVVFSFPDKSNPPVFDKCDWHCVSHIEAAWDLAYSIASVCSAMVLIPSHSKHYYSKKGLVVTVLLLTQFYTKLEEKHKALEAKKDKADARKKIEAHSGGLNDIAVSRPNKQPFVVTWEMIN